MSGLSLVNAAKEQKSKARFVLVSAYAEFEYAKEALSLGVDDYLLKPPTKAELVKTLNNLEHIIKYGTRTSRNDSLKEQYTDANPIIRDVLDIIETGYAGNLNQQEIALKLGVSPEYLSYLFAKNIGKPFSKFVREYRIETACSLLKSGQILSRDIPYQVGFSDAKYFAKVFHEVTGESLTDFTRNL